MVSWPLISFLEGLYNMLIWYANYIPPIIRPTFFLQAYIMIDLIGLHNLSIQQALGLHVSWGLGPIQLCASISLQQVVGLNTPQHNPYHSHTFYKSVISIIQQLYFLGGHIMYSHNISLLNVVAVLLSNSIMVWQISIS